MKRSSRGMAPAELLAGLKDPKARAHVEAQLADRDVKPSNVLHRDTKPDNVLPAAEKTDEPRYRSKAERDYAAWLHGISGIVWRYERHPIRLPGAGTRYLTDFSLRCRGGTELGPRDHDGRAPALPCYARPCLVDVKGTKGDQPFWRGESRRRALDGAAEWWESLGVPLFVAWRVGGQWKHERVEVRP